MSNRRASASAQRVRFVARAAQSFFGMLLVPCFTRTSVLQRGAVIVEVAFILPLFFVSVLLLMWLAVGMNAKSSVTSAVVNAVRLAATRGRSDLVGEEMIKSIDDFHSGRSTSYPILLADGVNDPDSHYREWVTRIFPDRDPNQNGPALARLPVQALYAIAYAHEAIRLSATGRVRYPCDPYDARGRDGEGGAGCISCKLLNPEDLSEEPYTVDNGYPTASDQTGLIESRIGLKCEYQPDNVIVTPLSRVLNLINNSKHSTIKVVISRTGYFDTIRRMQ